MRYAFLASLLLLTGCATPLARLQNVNPEANNFPSALASEYQAYAESEAEQGRDFSAQYFAKKGLKALSGERVVPEQIGSLPRDDQAELGAARNALMAVKTEDMEKVAPQKLARAQLLFDCWAHEVERHINQEEAPCAEEFRSAIGELQDIAESFAYSREESYTIGFAPRSARLDREAHGMLREIARQAEKAENYTVEMKAHEALGQRARWLTEKRLAALRLALARAGVPEARVKVRREDVASQVYLSCDVPDEDTDTVTITVKTAKPAEEQP